MEKRFLSAAALTPCGDGLNILSVNPPRQLPTRHQSLKHKEGQTVAPDVERVGW